MKITKLYHEEALQRKSTKTDGKKQSNKKKVTLISIVKHVSKSIYATPLNNEVLGITKFV